MLARAGNVCFSCARDNAAVAHGRFDSTAVRVTNHPLVVALCNAYGKPLVSTSANLSGLPPCRTVEEVRAQFGDDFPVVEGATGGRLNPSEIRDALTGELFRQG